MADPKGATEHLDRITAFTPAGKRVFRFSELYCTCIDEGVAFYIAGLLNLAAREIEAKKHG